ncbi:TetR family transcriptional regulator, partial [Mediterranea massiliensis]
MITNREEVLENALRVFAKMNYEKASLVTIAKACGLSKWGLIYYYSFKQDLFV